MFEYLSEHRGWDYFRVARVRTFLGAHGPSSASTSPHSRAASGAPSLASSHKMPATPRGGLTSTHLFAQSTPATTHPPSHSFVDVWSSSSLRMRARSHRAREFLRNDNLYLKNIPPLQALKQTTIETGSSLGGTPSPGLTPLRMVLRHTHSPYSPTFPHASVDQKLSSQSRPRGLRLAPALVVHHLRSRLSVDSPLDFLRSSAPLKQKGNRCGYNASELNYFTFHSHSVAYKEEDWVEKHLFLHHLLSISPSTTVKQLASLSTVKV